MVMTLATMNGHKGLTTCGKDTVSVRRAGGRLRATCRCGPFAESKEGHCLQLRVVVRAGERGAEGRRTVMMREQVGAALTARKGPLCSRVANSCLFGTSPNPSLAASCLIASITLLLTSMLLSHIRPE